MNRGRGSGLGIAGGSGDAEPSDPSPLPSHPLALLSRPPDRPSRLLQPSPRPPPPSPCSQMRPSPVRVPSARFPFLFSPVAGSLVIARVHLRTYGAANHPRGCRRASSRQPTDGFRPEAKKHPNPRNARPPASRPSTRLLPGEHLRTFPASPLHRATRIAPAPYVYSYARGLSQRCAGIQSAAPRRAEEGKGARGARVARQARNSHSAWTRPNARARADPVDRPTRALTRRVPQTWNAAKTARATKQHPDKRPRRTQARARSAGRTVLLRPRRPPQQSPNARPRARASRRREEAALPRGASWHLCIDAEQPREDRRERPRKKDGECSRARRARHRDTLRGEGPRRAPGRGRERTQDRGREDVPGRRRCAKARRRGPEPWRCKGR